MVVAAILIILGIAGFFFFRGSGSKTSTSSGTKTTNVPNSVSIENFSFKPGELTVKKGTVVTWTNNDSVTHTVVSDSNIFDSGNIDPGATFKHTFDQSGTFTYHCRIHPSMTGKVVVQ